jgi:hypothetical protein
VAREYKPQENRPKRESGQMSQIRLYVQRVTTILMRRVESLGIE